MADYSETHDVRLTTWEGVVPPPVWIEVDLSAVARNFVRIRKWIPPGVKILTVVKANAYGLGLLPVTRALVDAGADYLAVASVVEGVALRQAGIPGKILVLGQLLPDEAPLVAYYDLTQALGDEPSASALSRAAVQFQKPVAFHLKVDTGMGRYGVWHEEAMPLLERLTDLPGLQREGIFTHFSSAGQSIPISEEQMLRYRQLVERMSQRHYPTGLRHVANSVGLIRFPESYWDMVRTGLLLYGASPVRENQPFFVEPTLALKSRIRFIKRIEPGRTVSYGGTFRAENPTVVATLPVGYAHGYARALSNKAAVLVRGRRAPVIGKITMEDLMIDVTAIPDAAIGDEAVLIGRQGDDQITAEELARHARTIPYEILVGLSPSVPRRYLPAQSKA